MILNRRSILAVFAFILVFVSMPAFAICDLKTHYDNGYNAGLAAGKASCSACETCPEQKPCPVCETCPPPTICPTCQNCTNLAQQARASGLAQGNVEGKNICKNDLSTCFEAQPFKPSANPLADEFCDYKTKNCFSTKQAVYFNAIYLGTEDAQGNPITSIPLPILLKDLQMEVILKGNKLLFLNEEWKKYFVAKEQQSKLTITVTGTGNVISYPSGINCGTDCKEIYKKDSPVELFAVPTSSTSFEEWTGDCTGNENKHSITMDNDKACTAVFK
jgi:hypothetical protein